MTTNVDIDILQAHSSGELTYREFNNEVSQRQDFQRWKLLDSIAKQPPNGEIRRASPSSSHSPSPSAPPASAPPVEPKSVETAPVELKPRAARPGLLKGYAAAEEADAPPPASTALKSLLRKVGS